MAQEAFPRLQPGWCSCLAMVRVLFVDCLLQPFCMTDNSSSDVSHQRVCGLVSHSELVSFLIMLFLVLTLALVFSICFL